MTFDLQRFALKTVTDGEVYEVTLEGGGSSDLAEATGTLSVVHGGTGKTVLSAVTVGNADRACLDSAGNQISTSYLRKNNSDTMTGDLVISGDNSITGNATISGNLRLKGAGNFGNKINFGDDDYVYLQENPDDSLKIKANSIRLISENNNVFIDGVNVTALGGNNIEHSGKHNIAYCSTAASTATKKCSLIGSYGDIAYIGEGSLLTVLFRYVNTASSPSISLMPQGDNI